MGSMKKMGGIGTVIRGVLLLVITHLWSSVDKHGVHTLTHTHTHFCDWMCCVQNETRVIFKTNKRVDMFLAGCLPGKSKAGATACVLGNCFLSCLDQEMRMSVTWTVARNWLSVRMTLRWRAQVSWKSSKLLAVAIWANGLTRHECWISWRRWATPLSRHPNALIQNPTSSLHFGFPGVLHYLIWMPCDMWPSGRSLFWFGEPKAWLRQRWKSAGCGITGLGYWRHSKPKPYSAQSIIHDVSRYWLLLIGKRRSPSNFIPDIIGIHW